MGRGTERVPRMSSGPTDEEGNGKCPTDVTRDHGCGEDGEDILGSEPQPTAAELLSGTSPERPRLLDQTTPLGLMSRGCESPFFIHGLW